MCLLLSNSAAKEEEIVVKDNCRISNWGGMNYLCHLDLCSVCLENKSYYGNFGSSKRDTANLISHKLLPPLNVFFFPPKAITFISGSKLVQHCISLIKWMQNPSWPQATIRFLMSASYIVFLVQQPKLHHDISSDWSRSDISIFRDSGKALY